MQQLVECGDWNKERDRIVSDVRNSAYHKSKGIIHGSLRQTQVNRDHHGRWYRVILNANS